MKVRISFYIIFLFLTVGVLSEDKYQFSKLDITKGLSNNQVNCILKDSKGFMWFGTRWLALIVMMAVNLRFISIM